MKLIKKISSLLTKSNLIIILLLVLIAISLFNASKTDVEKIVFRSNVSNWFYKIKPKISEDWLLTDDVCFKGYIFPEESQEERNKYFQEMDGAECGGKGGSLFRTPTTHRPGKSICIDKKISEKFEHELEYISCSKRVKNGRWIWIFGKKIIKVSD